MPDLNIRATQEVIIVIGDAGGDGGAVVVTPHGLKRVPDNNPGVREAYKALVKSFAVLQEAALKQSAIEQKR